MIFPLKIMFSKKKLFKLLAIALLFVAAGCWFITNPAKFVTSAFNNPTIIYTLGWLAVLFFGIIGIFSLMKFFNKNPALIVDALGITDKSSLSAAGYLAWTDINSLRVISFNKQQMIMLELTDAALLQQQTSLLKKFLLKYNYRNYQAHISISANAIDISFDKLLILLNTGVRNKLLA